MFLFFQDDLTRLKSIRNNFNWSDWEIKEKRFEVICEITNLINDWYDQLPNLRDIFRPEEIDCLLMMVNDGDKNLWIPWRRFIKFAVRTGLKDKPNVDKDGKPLLDRDTPVHLAAKSRYYDIVGELFQIYDTFDVNYTDVSGFTHFHAACVAGCNEVVEKFLELGQDPNCLVPETGDSPLHLTFKNYDHINKKVVELLLRKGANPNLSNEDGVTPLHIICQRNYGDDCMDIFFKILDDMQQTLHIDTQNNTGNRPLHLALLWNNKKLVEWLLRRGADPNMANEYGETPLHMCATNLDLMKLFLKINKELDQTVQVNVRNKFGDTPLHLALQNKSDKEQIELLLRRGANPNSANEEGSTSLHVICQKISDDDDDMVKMLFEFSEEVNQPLQINARDKRGDTPLHSALDYGHMKVAELLVTRGADLNCTNEEGWTPLHMISARYNWDGDLVNLFFKIIEKKHHTVQVNAQDNEGNTALHLALSRYNNKNEAESLLRKGANPNLANAEGLTPLHIICNRYRDDDLAALFFKVNKELDQPVQVDSKDKKGRTPLQLAVSYLMPDMVNVLLNNGADLSSFVFLTDAYFSERYQPWTYDITFKFKLASVILLIVERLERSGYDFNRSDALMIMKLFTKHGVFEKSADIEKHWYEDEEFRNKAKDVMVNSSLSLYDSIRLRPEEASKLVTYKDYVKLLDWNQWRGLAEGLRKACLAHLCKTITRGFCLRWTQESFLELTNNQLLTLCREKLINFLENEDLFEVCMAADNYINEPNQNP